MRISILSILSILVISGCGSKNSNTGSSQTTGSHGTEVNTNELVGTWEVGQKRTFTMVFGEDGSWDLTIPGWGTSNGTYTFDNGKVTFLFEPTAPICANVEGAYKMVLTENNQRVTFETINDPCQKREKRLNRNWRRVGGSPAVD